MSPATQIFLFNSRKRNMAGRFVLMWFAVIIFMALPVIAQQVEPGTSGYVPEVDSLTGNELSILPFRGTATDYYDVFPSTAIIQRHGRMETHIRGSRWEETDYLFEGANIRSMYGGRPLLHFIPEMLSSLTLHKSPEASLSSAPFVLNHHLLAPASQFQFAAHAETDWFTQPHQSVAGTYTYGYQDYLLMLSGPLFTPQLTFRLGAEYRYFMDHYRKFWDGFRFGGSGISFVDPVTGDDYSEIIGQEMVIEPGNIPQAHSHDLLVNALLQGNWGNFHLQFVGALEDNFRQSNKYPIRDRYDPEHIPENNRNAYLLSTRATYQVPDGINLGFQYDYLNSRYTTRDPILKDEFQKYGPSISQMNIYYFYFTPPGKILSTYLKGGESGHSLSGFISGTAGNHHWKAGAQWQKRTLRRFKTNKGYGSYFLQNPDKWLSDSLYTQFYIYSNFLDDAFGYDVYGRELKESSEYWDGPVRPQQVGAYVEDTYQNGAFLLHLGVRLDMLSSNTIGVKDITQLHFLDIGSSGAKYISSKHFYRTTFQKYISPRFYFSYLFRPQTKFYLSFGRYVQQAQLQDLTTSRLWLHQYLWNELLLLNYFNPYPYALEVEPISSYSGGLGLQHHFLFDLRLSTSLFYKKTSNYLSVEYEKRPTNAGYNSIYFLNNLSSSSVYGLELNLKYKNFLWLNYSFTDGKGKGSYSNSDFHCRYSHDIQDAYRCDEELPLEHIQKHQLNALLSYSTGEASSALWRAIRATAFLRLNSGRNFYIQKAFPNSYIQPFYGDLLTDNYSWVPRAKPEVTHTPLYFTLDIKLSKTFHLGKAELTPYIYIQNLLNRKNTIDLYPRNGKSDYDDYKELDWGMNYPSETWILYEKINLQHRQHFALMQNGSDLFAHPREFRFGIQIGM